MSAQLNVLKGQLEGLTTGQESLQRSVDQVLQDMISLMKVQSNLVEIQSVNGETYRAMAATNREMRSDGAPVGFWSDRVEPKVLSFDDDHPGAERLAARFNGTPQSPGRARPPESPREEAKSPRGRGGRGGRASIENANKRNSITLNGRESSGPPRGRRRPSTTSSKSEAMGGDDEKKEKDRLKNIFLNAEAQEAEEAYWAERRGTVAGAIEAVKAMDKARLETLIDSFMAFVITANAFSIGIQEDFKNDDNELQWNVIDGTFSVLFVAELTMKLMILGFKGQYCGSGKVANWFDSFLIFTDLFGWVMFFVSSAGIAIPVDLTALRVMRLARLGRILRLFRLEMFSDLLSMITGMVGGMRTLVWAILLFLVILYVMALVCKQMVHGQFKESDLPMDLEVSYYFRSVSRSMFTVFRCSFGDCSTEGGVPLFELLTNSYSYGAAYALLYCFMIVFFTVGLMNVISAIFVESTMNAANDSKLAKKANRLQDEDLWASRITKIIRCLMMFTKEGVPDTLSSKVEDVLQIEVAAEVFDELVRIPVVVSALNDLDINPDDHRYLTDILDPDNGGSITVNEMVDGIARLRGEPRRSDIVTVDLMIRSLQEQVGEILETIQKSQKDFQKEVRHMTQKFTVPMGQ